MYYKLGMQKSALIIFFFAINRRQWVQFIWRLHARHSENTRLLYQRSPSRCAVTLSVCQLVEDGCSNEANPTTTTTDVHRRTHWTPNDDWTRNAAVACSPSAQRPTERLPGNQYARCT